MPVSPVPIWKKAPCIRLLAFIIPGILLQYHLPIKLYILWFLLFATALVLLAFFFIPFFNRFRWLFLSGFATCILFASLGALLISQQDIRNDPYWIGRSFQQADAIIADLDEPPLEKANSFKANATIPGLIRENFLMPARGRLIFYFQKDSLQQPPGYGDRLLIKKKLQTIINSGNPAGFDYKRYSIFQNISHQVYLKTGEFKILHGQHQHWVDRFIYASRGWVLTILRRNIQPKKEAGLAEALLIGYKNDLDKTLVQSYSNTGVVHIIAISGLHLGLIYWLLTRIFRPLQRRPRWRWLFVLLVITGLWLFTLLAGAQPSVLRSAVMFTCIAVAQGISRKTSIYNSLAFSAMVLLCYNPFWLWDVGFQLSYAAVLSIVIFNRPVYNLFYFKNKVLDGIWKMNAVTLAAQLLTIPVCIYHFHQFPNYFLLTNFIAVPLSSLILMAEILLCCIYFIPWLALLTGKLITWLIWLMNEYVETIERFPFALTNDLQINILQAILLTLAITAFAYWRMQRSATALKGALLAVAIFAGIRYFALRDAMRQRQLIVYNIPKHLAIDIMDGRHFYFIGDSALTSDELTQRFHLRPSRILYRVQPANTIIPIKTGITYLGLYAKKIILLNKTTRLLPAENKTTIDLLIVSQNPRLYFTTLLRSFQPKQVVFDSSVPRWKLGYWIKDCDSLKIPWHDVSKQGAFVMKLN